ncbi:YjbE family putative metal transport protein [Azospirillum formosense]|uniref:YjbE family putative metal transport protein n=1 Tax=Azospirillum formosense TaxID=861533 RepID=A0ABX2KSM1_9PROT|nr:YjbE family putative metal transport protein [Azospirillum formosense]MBY3756941.1 YjbE family putative metal transport protein [Azospirillum formosense]NUB19644.1 YjbE family putative metal transport protein [Azospirillum formosense]
MMTAELWPQLVAFGQVVAIDLVLAGDNAIVVGMAAAAVPAEQRRRVILWGISAAIVLRIIFALMTTQLLAIIGLTLAGGVLLLWVCWKMFRELRSQGADEITPEEALDAPDVLPGTASFSSSAAVAAASTVSVAAAVWQIVVADVSMSLDNVLAVAGAAKEHPTVLVLGLLLSVALMGAAANVIARVLHNHRWIGWIGLAIITYVALDMVWRGSNEVLAHTAWLG